MIEYLSPREVVTCSTDKSIFIWDLNTCERIKKIKGHKSFVNSISLSKTSTPLICSGSDDCTVKVNVHDQPKLNEIVDFNVDL